MCTIVAFVFIAAVTRAINRPIQWTIDASQFLLAWTAFLGADMGFRASKVLGVDILTRKLPEKMQTAIRIVTNFLILAMLISFVYFGIKISMDNYLRRIPTLGISYSWVTISLPVSCVLMSITAVISLKKDILALVGKQAPLSKQEA